MSADTTKGTDYERGRQIAEQMMDHAEARHRHERGQVHRRAECEDCAREAAAARPVHYREAADSLDAAAAHRKINAVDAIGKARAEGINDAARLLRQTSRDFEDDTAAALDRAHNEGTRST